MSGETTNLPTGGSDSAQPSISLEDAENIDFFDPGEDNEEVVEEQHSDDETDGAEDARDPDDPAEEDDKAEAEEEGEADETAEDTPEPKDDVTVTVNGEQIALSDLKAGYMRQADYTRKTQVVSQKEKDLDALSARVTGTVNAVADFLAKQIPAMPDLSLSQTDPVAFMRQKALHDAAMQNVHTLLSKAGEVKDVGNKLSAQQRQALIEGENAKLAEAFPQTATTEGRRKFFDEAASMARELGYSDEEIKQATDHRLFALAHYARLGKQAEQARVKAVKKVENAPPVAPQKRQPGVDATKAARNKEAMKRLAKTGSIDDAMSVDWG